MTGPALTDSEVVDLLRRGSEKVGVRAPAEAPTGWKSRVRRAQARRVARFAAPIATAAAVALVALGVTHGAEDAAVVSAPRPPVTSATAPPRDYQLRPVTFTPAQAAALPTECSQSFPGPARPGSNLPTFGQRVIFAVGDDHGVTAYLANEAIGLTTICDLSLDASGQPDIASAAGHNGGIPLLSTSKDLRVDAAEGRPAGAIQRSDGLTVQAARGQVSDRVRRLTMTSPAGTVIEVPIQAGGLFVGRSFQRDPPQPTPPYPRDIDHVGDDPCQLPGWPAYVAENKQYLADVTPVLRAYDSRGRLLAEARFADPTGAWSGGRC